MKPKKLMSLQKFFFSFELWTNFISDPYKTLIFSLAISSCWIFFQILWFLMNLFSIKCIWKKNLFFNFYFHGEKKNKNFIVLKKLSIFINAFFRNDLGIVFVVILVHWFFSTLFNLKQLNFLQKFEDFLMFFFAFHFFQYWFANIQKQNFYLIQLILALNLFDRIYE